MNDHADHPQAIIDHLQARATRHETPCGEGRMVWHLWDESGGTAPVAVLFHGGAGSWRHWIRTIPALLPAWRVLVPDLPGLGESDMPPEPDDADAIAAVVADGIDRIIGPETSYDVVGFSFGGTMAACVGALRGKRVRSVTIIGSSGVGALGSQVKLEKVRHLEGQERWDTHRVNLSRLMIADPDKIDDLAVVIQDWNTVRSRLRTPQISRSGAIMRAIDRLQSPLNGMWGEFDAPANPKGPERVETLRKHKPDADIRLIPKTGHWAAYESPDFVNPALLDMLGRTRPKS
ncbi:alpha/beta fold hydrolase [Rhodopila sp.]|jgi:pimeloyl-ACP methyl ester carboxylesterase|uniref:alpha/beta fold hydrolase n=1 Tax=Rhodopila sp. TaxID=2480087 RepID=UPI002BBDDF85|nr:alpha/beta hydrolase [Rhodopila sp.]HVZ09895.1 alpha/beta hydrolase [Rhodopila sp.]